MANWPRPVIAWPTQGMNTWSICPRAARHGGPLRRNGQGQGGMVRSQCWGTAAPSSVAAAAQSLAPRSAAMRCCTCAAVRARGTRMISWRPIAHSLRALSVEPDCVCPGSIRVSERGRGYPRSECRRNCVATARPVCWSARWSHEGVCSPNLARLTVIKDMERYEFPLHLCQHCDDPACLAACPSGAMAADERGTG